MKKKLLMIVTSFAMIANLFFPITSYVAFANNNGFYKPFEAYQKKGNLFRNGKTLNEYNQPKLTSDLKDVMFPNIVDQILDLFPAFEYLRGSSVGLGIEVREENAFPTAGLVASSIWHSMPDKYGNVSGVEKTSGIGFDLASYKLHWNQYTGYRDRNKFEHVMVHEMFHVFMNEAMASATASITADRKLQKNQAYPLWFYEGSAQAVSGDRSGQFAGLNQNSHDKTVRSLIKDISNINNTNLSYGKALLATMFFGQLASGKEEYSADNVIEGLNNIFHYLISGNSFEKAIKQFTPFNSIEDFEQNAYLHEKTASFIKWYLGAMDYDETEGEALGALFTRDLMESNLVPDTRTAGKNPLFAIDPDAHFVINVEPRSVEMLSGGLRTIDGVKPVAGYQSTPVFTTKIDTPSNLNWDKSNGNILATWSTQENVKSYFVQLYRDENKIFETTVNDNKYDFTDLLVGEGSYYFTVKSKSYNYKTEDSDIAKVEKAHVIKSGGGDKPLIFGAANRKVNKGIPIHLAYGLQAFDTEDGDITDKIQIKVNGDLDTVGDHIVTYKVMDSDQNVTSVNSKITILPFDSRLTVINGANDVVIPQNSSFDMMAGVSAIDQKDGDLTANVNVSGYIDTTVPGVYMINYSVINSQLLTTRFSRQVTVKSDEVNAPVIKASDKTIRLGEKFYYMDGVKVTDKEDGDLMPLLVISGRVDRFTLGVYEIKYSVTDSDGNYSELKIKVTVKP